MRVIPSNETRDHAYAMVYVSADKLLTSSDIDTWQTPAVEAEANAVAALANVLVRSDYQEAQTAVYKIHAQSLADSSYQSTPKQIDRQRLCQQLRQLKAWDLVAYVERQSQLPAQARYHLACYYSTLSEAADKFELRDPCLSSAVQNLSLALEDPILRAQAAIDESLQIIKRFRPRSFESEIFSR